MSAAKGPISYEEALGIAHEFAREAARLDPPGILGIFLVGSLGGGYYRAGQSDIDTVIIAKDGAAVTQKALNDVAARYWRAHDIPKGFGSILIRESSLKPPFLEESAVDYEFAVEVARLKAQGKRIYGAYDIGAIPMPSREHFIRDALVMEKWLRQEFGYPMYDKLGVTGCVNCILGTMRRFLMIEKGRFEFNKFRTVDAYLRNDPDTADARIFAIIDAHLRGELESPSEHLGDLRTFGQAITDHYNQKLLGLQPPDPRPKNES